ARLVWLRVPSRHRPPPARCSAEWGCQARWPPLGSPFKCRLLATGYSGVPCEFATASTFAEPYVRAQRGDVVIGTAAAPLRFLGLELGATPEEVQARYRLLARMWHPDRFASDPAGCAIAAERMRAINEAVSWLREHEAVWANAPAFYRPATEPVRTQE